MKISPLKWGAGPNQVFLHGLAAVHCPGYGSKGKPRHGMVCCAHGIPTRGVRGTEVAGGAIYSNNHNIIQFSYITNSFFIPNKPLFGTYS
jgi:hypothetical protein